MKDDRQVLEIYISFVTGPMNDLFQLFTQGERLIHKSNLLNRKKNMNILRNEFQQFHEKVCSAWERIYISSSHYSDSLKQQNNALQNRRTIYAVTLYQKLIEQFFCCMHLAMQLFIADFNNEKANRKTDMNPFSTLNFAGVDLVMKDIFPLVLEEMKKHSINMSENTKESFVEVNRIYLRNSSI